MPSDLISEDLTISDIEIGAVELKDHTNDIRSSVGSNGIAYAPVQNGAFIGAPDTGGVARIVTATVSGARRALDVNPVSSLAVANRTSFDARRITVVTAGTPVQLPAIVIPNGFSVVVRNNVDNVGNDVVYVANSAVNAVLADSRFTLDNGDSVALKLDNVNKIFVDSNNNGTLVDFILET